MTECVKKQAETNEQRARQLAACGAALSLIKRKDPNAMRALIALSRDNDPIVRARAAECLMEAGGQRAIIGLMNLLDDNNPDVRQIAIDALGVLRAYIAMEKLETILAKDPDVKTRLRAARSLGKLGSKIGLLLIIRLLDEKDEYLKRLAVRSLQDIIGKYFEPTAEGVKSAKRYLEINMHKFIDGGAI